MTSHNHLDAVTTTAGATIGVDIGGTGIEAVLVEHDSIVNTASAPTRRGVRHVVDDITSLCTTILRNCGSAQPTLIGIGIPGMVDEQTGTVRQALNLGIDEVNLHAIIGDRLGMPVHVANDVNAAALAADHQLSGGSGTTVFVNFGTGIAAGIVVNGSVLVGASGGIGEIGHIPVDPHGLLCTCGQRGCLETVASGGAIARQWKSDTPYPVQDLFDAAAQGNQRACQIKRRMCFGMARAIQLVTQTFDPDLIALGGGVMRAGDALLAGVHEAVQQMESSSPFFARLDVWSRVCSVADIRHLGAIGAALLGRQALDAAVAGMDGVAQTRESATSQHAILHEL